MPAQQIDALGFYVVRAAITDEVVESLLSALVSREIVVTRSRGVRNLASKVGKIAEVAASSAIAGLAESVLGRSPRLVRSILFDKVEGANWAIRWHQDKTIAVRRRIDVDGYGPWSVKEGVLSVQPPAAILQRMVSVRIHLDDCHEANGALRVIPGSHRAGRLSRAQLDRYVAEGPRHVCEGMAGDALLMRPLLVHASSPSRTPSHRRVVHLDYAVGELDGGLEWSSDA